MKFLKYLSTILVSLILSINLAIAEKWDMALAYGAGNFHSANAAEFAKNVTEKSGGKLTIVTHPGGSLFKGGEIFRAVRTGQAQIGERFMSALGKEDPLLEVDSQPFLATSYADAMKLYKASKDEIVKGLDEKGLVFLYAVPWPAQGLYSKKEINSVEDLKGLKFRAYNSATIRIAELTGMAPTKIEAGEISQAFSTGAVEMKQAALAERKGWQLSKQGNVGDKKALADAGMVVGKVNAPLQAHFEKVGETMAKEWSQKAGSRGAAVLSSYK